MRFSARSIHSHEGIKTLPYRLRRLNKYFLLDVLPCWVAERELGSQEDFEGSKVLCKDPKSRSSDVWDSTDNRPGLPDDIADDAAPKMWAKINVEFAFPYSCFDIGCSTTAQKRTRQCRLVLWVVKVWRYLVEVHGV